ncbi:MAG: prenyltransferase [Deltaproteobacteria bacterium]
MNRTVRYIALARLPFHIVGILPLALGAYLAARSQHAFSIPVFLFSLAGVMLTITATHYNGECYDVREDGMCARRTPFSSGTGLALTGEIAPAAIARGATLAAAAALAAGFILQAGFKTGPLTVLLGSAGLAAGYFYSKPPLRLVKRGVGEFLIAFCYGWLLPACGSYTQAGYIHPLIPVIAVPVAFSTVNIIWINEILDLPQDRAAGKNHLVVRLGLARSVWIYRAFALAGACASLLAVSVLQVPDRLPALFPALAASLAAAVLLDERMTRPRLLAACGLTLFVNIADSLALFFLLS